MEDEMLEQTNKEVEDQEIEETTEESTETKVEQEVEETQPEKLFTQAQVDEMLKNREARARKKVEREYKSSLSKLNELAYLNQKGLNANDLDETLEKTREFYSKQGIKYVPSNTDDEIVGKVYADEIINESDSIDDIREVINKINQKSNPSNREKIVLQNLNEEIEKRNRISELKSIGVKEEEYNSEEFKKFCEMFNKKTPIKDVYEIYKKNKSTTQEVDNPGSMKTVAGKEKKNFISEAEFDKMSKDEIAKYSEIIKESMLKW